MLESSEYVLAWLAYLLSAVGVLAVWWRVTRFIPWMPLKQLLRVLVAAPMLIPAPVAEGALEWAPALFVLLFDITLVKEGDGPVQCCSSLGTQVILRSTCPLRHPAGGGDQQPAPGNSDRYRERYVSSHSFNFL